MKTLPAEPVVLIRPGHAVRVGWARLLLLALAAGVACSRPPKAPVVLISVDTLRADHLPVYGYRGVSTPAIDAIARDSIVFESAYSNVPLTLPSHAALLTGLLPYENGVRDNIGFRLSPAHATLAGILRSRSYATGAAVSSFVLRRDRGLEAGFDFYDDSMPENPTRERAGIDSAATLEKWASTVKEKPPFLFLHLYEPHAPYAPPEPFKTRYASSPYDGEIAAADAAVGGFTAFLKRTGIYDRAILIFLSDHGEGLGDHGEEEHGVFLYREAIRVPLLVKLPGSDRNGRVVRDPVSLTDVVPTVLSLLSIPVPGDLHGLPLTSLERGAKAADRRIYSETLYPRLGLGWSELASLVDGRYHYIHAPRPELYDLAADPGERRDLASGLPTPLRSMRAALEAMSRPFSMPEPSTTEEVKKLAALGYISISPGERAGPLPDPKDKVDALRELKGLFELYYAGKYVDAISEARALVAREPRVFSAWTMLSDSLDHTGRRSEAIEVLKTAISQAVPENPSPEQLSAAYDSLFALLQKAGDLAGCERTLREAVGRGLASEPMKRDLARLFIGSRRPREAAALLENSSPLKEPESLDTLGVALAGSGRSADAKKAFLAALAIQPGDARIAFNLGTLLLDEGDAAGARDWFVKSLKAEPGAAATWSQLGQAQARLEDSEGAAESWRKAISLDSRQYNSLYNLALWELKAGRYEEAREKLRRFIAAAPRIPYGEQVAQARRLLGQLRIKRGW